MIKFTEKKTPKACPKTNKQTPNQQQQKIPNQQKKP